MKNMLVFLISLMLTACTQTVVPKFDSPYYKIPLGSILVLHQSLTIPPNQARVIIQNGRLISRRDRDQYYPYCEFEIRTLSESEQVILPDRFRIHKLWKHMDTSRQQVMYASVGLMLADNNDPLVAYNTIMFLSSDKQPDVYRMSCMYWTDDPLDQHLSVNQINKTLGDILSIEITD